MINNVLRVAIYCLVFLSIQVLVLNNIHFLRLATPFLYVYILLKMPVGTQPVRLLLLAFFTGLVVDSFTNTAGMHAAACCLAAFARNPLINLLAGKDIPAAGIPSAALFGKGAFLRYTLGFVMLHHIALFLIESLTLFDPLYLVFRLLGSICLTTLLIYLADAFNLHIPTSNES